jgi:hypothetical protein
MNDDTENWTKADWALYKQLVRRGQDGEIVRSQAAIREVNRQRARRK